MRTNKIVLLACFAAFAQQAFAADAPANPAAAAAPAAPAAAAKPVDPNAPAVVINGVAVSRFYAEIVRNDLIQRKRPGTDEQVRAVLVDNELLSQEAIKRGLDKSPEIQALLELQRKDVLGKVLVEDFIKNHAISEERAKAEYEQVKAQAGAMEYHSRHILVDDEKLAKSIIAQLGGKKPAKFEDLAKKHSKDPSAKQGGDLGWMAPASLVPEFSAAMVALKKGEYSKTPVKTQFGWHVIKLEDERKIDFPAFDKVKGRIENQLMQQDVRKFLNELRATAKIEVPGQK